MDNVPPVPWYAPEGSAGAYMRLVERRAIHRTQWLQALATAELDAILCPPFALPALIHGSSSELFPAAAYAIPFNVIGFPAGVAPIATVQPGEESDRAVGRDKVDIMAQAVYQHDSAFAELIEQPARQEAAHDDRAGIGEGEQTQSSSGLCQLPYQPGQGHTGHRVAQYRDCLGGLRMDFFLRMGSRLMPASGIYRHT
jgi:hypothetical protein